MNAWSVRGGVEDPFEVRFLILQHGGVGFFPLI